MESTDSRRPPTEVCVSPPPEKRRRLTARRAPAANLPKLQEGHRHEALAHDVDAQPIGVPEPSELSTAAPDSERSLEPSGDEGSATPPGAGPEGGPVASRVEVLEAVDDARPVRTEYCRRELLDRLIACARAREAVRGACHDCQEVLIRAQLLACYFVQSSQRPQDLAAAAAEAALEACGSTGSTAAGNGGTTAVEAMREAKAKLLELAGHRGGVPQLLPVDRIAGAVRSLVGRLPRSEAFRRSYCQGGPPHAAALQMAPRLVQVARCFVADAFMNPVVALELPPEAVAAAAVAVAARYELGRAGTEVPYEDLFGFLAAEASGEQLRLAVVEIVRVFRLWTDVHERSSLRPGPE